MLTWTRGKDLWTAEGKRGRWTIKQFRLRGWCRLTLNAAFLKLPNEGVISTVTEAKKLAEKLDTEEPTQ